MFEHGNIQWKENYGHELKTINDNGRKYVTPEGKFSSVTLSLVIGIDTSGLVGENK